MNYAFNQSATPQQYFEVVKRFTANPVAYHADVVTRNRAAQEREATERTRREAAERATQEARERSEREREQQRTEIATVKKSFTDRFGLSFDDSFEMLSQTHGFGRNEQTVLQNLKTATTALEAVGAAISVLRGFKLHLMHFGETRVEGWGKLIQINVNEKTEAISAKIIQAINLLKREQEAIATLENAKPFRFHTSGFVGVSPEKTIEYARRIQEAVNRAEHGWIIKSRFVHWVWVSRSHTNDSQVRFKITKSDPKLQSSIDFEIGINADTATIIKAMDAVGAELEKFYPSSAVAPDKAPLIAERLQALYGIRFSQHKPDSKILTPERRLMFLERFRAAYEKLTPDERLWLRNMTVNPPNEGARLFGRTIGSRRAWVQKNQLFAPYNVSEANILEALRGEVKKKMEA